METGKLKYKNGREVKIGDWVKIDCKPLLMDKIVYGQYVNYYSNIFEIKQVDEGIVKFTNRTAMYLRAKKLTKSEVVMLYLEN